MRDAFVKALLEEAKKDKNVILITGDLGFGVLDEFQKELPNQFINSGVNEQAMMGMAAGMASTGKRVFVYSIGNFPTLRCLEQIRNDICLMNNPVVIVSVGAGYAYGPQGYTHHALEDIAVMRALPNLDIVIPADPIETTMVTKFLANTKSPSYLRIGKNNEQSINSGEPTISPGKFNEITSGENGTILFVGPIGTIAIRASEELQKEGINVSVTSVPFLTTLDRDYLSNAAAKGPIITVEEHSNRGGFGSAIMEFVNREKIRADIGVIASFEKNLSQIGSQEFLRELNGLSVAAVVTEFMALREAENL
jgi:transketolase